MAVNLKKTQEDALAIINAALTILDNFPELDDNGGLNLSIGSAANPFAFLVQLFKTTAGYNALIKIISKFITYAIPPLEVTIKAVLLSNLKNILSCSLNPFISRDILKNGLVFDLRSLDMFNILFYNPKHEDGKYYYFGCDGMLNDDQCVHAGDFNAFLWYVKRYSLRRQVWYGMNAADALEDTAGTDGIVLQKGPVKAAPGIGDTKCDKKDGIITIAYAERCTSLRDAEGADSSFLQTPFNHCLQVFIGNTQETDENLKDLENELESINADIDNINKDIEEDEIELDGVSEELEINELLYKENKKEKSSYKDTKKDLLKKRKKLNKEEENKFKELNELNEKKLIISNTIKEIMSGNPTYRRVEQNYYYNRTLIEFDTDYIMSLKLFDSRSLAAQLIDALTGCLTIGVNLSYEQLLVKYETQKMVSAIVESDDIVVSDCFFTFSNDDYDRMLQKAELTREGLYVSTTGNATNVKIDADTILSGLNNINSSSTQAGLSETIEGLILDISQTVTESTYQEKNKFNLGLQLNFIENLLNNLAYVIVMTVLSPKVYLVLAMNLKLMGEHTGFGINDFIDMHKQLITQLLRAVRDEILKYLVNELTDLLADIAKQVAVKLTVEQAQYYARLIKRLIDCFKSNRNLIPFTVDNINYADILAETEEPVNNEC